MSDDPFELASAGDLLTASTIQPDDDNPLTDVQLFQVSYTYLRKHFIFGHCCNYLLIVYLSHQELLTTALENHKSQCVPLNADGSPCCKTCEVPTHEIELWDGSHRFANLHGEFSGKTLSAIAKEKGWVITERGIISQSLQITSLSLLHCKATRNKY